MFLERTEKTKRKKSYKKYCSNGDESLPHFSFKVIESPQKQHILDRERQRTVLDLSSVDTPLIAVSFAFRLVMSSLRSTPYHCCISICKYQKIYHSWTFFKSFCYIFWWEVLHVLFRVSCRPQLKM